jgi:carbamoyltransferase
MSLIIGISAHYHDSACCVLQDGVVVAAAQEERFTRIKHDARLPVRAFRYCLQAAGATIRDVDCIGYYEDPVKKAGRQIWAALPGLLTSPRLRFRIDPARAGNDIRESLGYAGPVEYVDHHLSHAASAYYFSGFSDAAVLTVDGVGEWATTSYGVGEGDRLELSEEVEFPHSLGLLYSAVTAYLGFEVNDAEYKVMGLAPYGTPRYVDRIRRLVEVLPGGQYRLDLQYFDFVAGERMYSDRLPELLEAPPRAPESDISSFHQDVAASVQLALEEILLDKVRWLHGRHPSDNLCMAGGVALNCVANGRIRREGPFRDLYVQPAASDAGGALGAAAVAMLRRTGAPPARERLRHVYLGPAYTGRDVARVVRQTPLCEMATDYTDRDGELIDAVARRLADGKVVGWFQGRMEFGPRALGARSILADPRRPEMRERINALVKMREAFRPFAPAVLESRMEEHFQLSWPSPFMLETCRVTSALPLPAVTHVDGSARVQTVGADAHPRFHALIQRFDELTGCPLLLNTSFNLRGEPIVMEPVDAIWTFAISNIDTLVLEDHVIDRGDQPVAWARLIEMLGARRAKRRATSDALNVYSFL